MKYLLLICIIPLKIFAQSSPKKEAKKLGPNPIIIIDSVRLSKEEFANFNPNLVTLATVLKDSVDLKEYGDEGKDGVVIFETRPFARKQFVRFFRTVSLKYDSLYKIGNSDSTFQYILNDRVQKDNYEGNLSIIDNSLFISLDILSEEELKRKYQISDKMIGVSVRSKMPNNLYHRRRKF